MNSEFDNTNRGSAHPPFPEQKFILGGPVDINGNKETVALIAGQTRDGTKVIEVYQKIGLMYQNENEEGSRKPDYSGPILQNKRLAGWKKIKTDEQGKEKAWMSLEVTEARQQQTQIQEPQSEIDIEDIPF